MFKVIIADDETLIREGLRDFVDWKSFGMDVVALAENGAQAIELIDSLQPDICILDIKMPFTDGLEVSEYYRNVNPGGVAIFFTGHDEFQYAVRALRASAFDFIKKPLNMSEMTEVLRRAEKHLTEMRKNAVEMEMTIEQMNAGFDMLRNNFVLRWLERGDKIESLSENLRFYKLDFQTPCGLILVTAPGIAEDSVFTVSPLVSVMSLLNETLEGFEPFFTLQTGADCVVSLVSIHDTAKWLELEKNLQGLLEKGPRLRLSVVFEKCGEVSELRNCYLDARTKSYRMSSLSPLLQALLDYIHKNYGDCGMSLSSFAASHNVTSSYLCRLFKQELEQSYSNYLTKLRIGKSLSHLSDPAMKIYEVAELAGFSNQYYFCNSFKKYMGVSPSVYRKKLAGK